MANPRPPCHPETNRSNSSAKTLAKLLTPWKMENTKPRKIPGSLANERRPSKQRGDSQPTMTRDPAEILEPFRKYLEVLAELHLDRRLRGKLDAADAVQQTMLRASSALAEVRDARPEVLAAWLRRILANTLADAVKHYERDKRDVRLERSIEADLDRSASGFAAWLAADQTSPSGRAERNEELLRSPKSAPKPAAPSPP
jgi:DNA-directed RNA polymerase specialized sigma24 family protein